MGALKNYLLARSSDSDFHHRFNIIKLWRCVELKKSKKNLFNVIAATCVLSMMFPVSAFAAQPSSKSISLGGGYTAYGSVSLGTNKATGSTSLLGADYTSVSLTYKYVHGADGAIRGGTVGNSGTNPGYSVTYSALNPPVANAYARADHYARVGDREWDGPTAYTETGNDPGIITIPE